MSDARIDDLHGSGLFTLTVKRCQGCRLEQGLAWYLLLRLGFYDHMGTGLLLGMQPDIVGCRYLSQQYLIPLVALAAV